MLLLLKDFIDCLQLESIFMPAMHIDLSTYIPSYLLCFAYESCMQMLQIFWDRGSIYLMGPPVFIFSDK